MSGAKSGCKVLIQQKAPLALYTHCAAHKFNLSIVAACSIQAFRNTEASIGEMAHFLKFTLKRQQLLDRAIYGSSKSSAKSKKG